MRFRLRTALRRAKALSAGGGSSQALLDRPVLAPLASNVTGTTFALTDTGTTAHNVNVTVTDPGFYATLSLGAVNSANRVNLRLYAGNFDLFVIVGGNSYTIRNAYTVPTSAQASNGDVIQAEFGPDGTFSLRNATKNLLMTAPIAAGEFVDPANPQRLSALGTKVGLNIGGEYSAYQTKYGYGLTQPAIRVSAQTIDLNTLKPRATFFYNNPSGTLFNGARNRKLHVFNGVDTVLSDWQDAVLIENATAGVATFEAASGFDTTRRGNNEYTEWQIKNQPASISDRILTPIPPYPRLGVNLPTSEYFTRSTSMFRDWTRFMKWKIVGGTYAGKSMHELRVAGILDINARLQSWPTGATSVILDEGPRFVLPDEIAGGRTLVLPPGQDFTLTDFGNGTLTKNLTTGVHTITWPSGRPDGVGLFITLDQASFKVQDRLSLRQTGDTTGKILTSWAIANLSPFEMARPLDLVGTNNNDPTTWGPFSQRLNWRWSPEAFIELANDAGVAPWIMFTLETTASDAAQYVSMLEAGISSSIKTFYCDCFNEVWGGIVSLMQTWARKGVLQGRHLNNGYGAPLDPATVYYYDSYSDDAFNITGDDGRTAQGIPFAMASGSTLLLYRYGGDGQAIYVAKSNLPLGTPVPAKGVGDANWTYYGNARDLPRARQYGVDCQKIAVACKAVSSRFKIAINSFGYPSGGTGTFEYVALSFPVTQGGTDNFGSVVDALAIAAYANYGDDAGWQSFNSETTFTGRMSKLNSLFGVTTGALKRQTMANAKVAFQTMLNALGRDIPADIWSYEFTVDLSRDSMSYEQGQALTAFFKGQSGSQAGPLMTNLINSVFTTASVGCMFHMGDGGFDWGIAPGGSGPAYTYTSQENIQDFTSPVIAAMRERSAYFRSLRPAT